MTTTLGALLAVALLGAQHWTIVPAQVLTCYDGDTCTGVLHLPLGAALTGQKLRLCGINAPELRGSHRSAGMRSRDALWSWLSAAVEVDVAVLRSPDCRTGCERRDKYGRWLVQLHADGVDLGARLVKEGFARAARCR